MEDDVCSNHIHAEDLARATWLAIFRGRSRRVINVVDDSELLMGQYFDQVADAVACRARRLPRAQLIREVSPMLYSSFMSESRRIDNARMKRELRLRLAYPTPVHFLRQMKPAPRCSERCCEQTRPIAMTTLSLGQIKTKLDAYERLIRLDKPVGFMLSVANAVGGWDRHAWRTRRAAGRHLRAGHHPHALGRLRDQRLGRPRFDGAIEAHGDAPLAAGEISGREGAVGGRGVRWLLRCC